jgi:hypothetical protein
MIGQKIMKIVKIYDNEVAKCEFKMKFTFDIRKIIADINNYILTNNNYEKPGWGSPNYKFFYRDKISNRIHMLLNNIEQY